jgi:hypothetical protein
MTGGLLLLSIDDFAFVLRSFMCSPKQRNFPVKLLRLVIRVPSGIAIARNSLLRDRRLPGLPRSSRWWSYPLLQARIWGRACGCPGARSSWEVRQPKPGHGPYPGVFPLSVLEFIKALALAPASPYDNLGL